MAFTAYRHAGMAIGTGSGLAHAAIDRNILMCSTNFLYPYTRAPITRAGMAIGTGSGLAHAAIDRVFSSKHPEPAEAAQAAQQIAAAPAADVRPRCGAPDCVIATQLESESNSIIDESFLLWVTHGMLDEHAQLLQDLKRRCSSRPKPAGAPSLLAPALGCCMWANMEAGVEGL